MKNQKDHKHFQFIAAYFAVILFAVGIILAALTVKKCTEKDVNEQTVASEVQTALTAFPEDPDNEKYLTLDADNIFSEELKSSLAEFEQKEIEKYLEENATTEDESETEDVTADEEQDIIEEESTEEYHFEYFGELSETEKTEKVSGYVDAMLNTIILEDYSEETLFESAGAEKDEEKDLIRFMLRKMFEDEKISEKLNEEYGTWYTEHSNRTSFENIIKELQFVTVAEKNYLSLRGETLECPADVLDITKCDMDIVMIGKQGNSYFYIVTDKYYQHQYLITFASAEEYSMILFE